MSSDPNKIFKNRGLVGFPNLGNTCFMNTIYSAISSVIPFAKLLLYKEFEINHNQDNSKAYYYIFVCLANLIICYYNNNKDGIQRNIEMLKDNFQIKTKWSCHIQQDAHEFLIQLFNIITSITSTTDTDSEKCESYYDSIIQIKESETSVISNFLDYFEIGNDHKPISDTIVTLKKISDLAKKEYVSHHKCKWSKFTEIFGGQFCKMINCVCGHMSVKFDPFLIWSIPIFPLRIRDRQSEGIPLQDCMDRYVMRSQFDLENKYHCEKCKNSNASHKSSIWMLPDNLIIHIKRFSFDHESKKSSKIIDPIDFPLENLDLSSYISTSNEVLINTKESKLIGNYKYKLTAVVNHSGNINEGHYYTFAKNQNGSWYCFNDTLVSKISDLSQINVNNKNAYILFYSKAGPATN